MDSLNTVITWILPMDLSHFGTSYIWARWVFLRIMGFSLLFAFYSLSRQILGLIGDHGILAARDYLSDVKKKYPTYLRFLKAPSLIWLSTHPYFLKGLCYTGGLASCLLIANIAPQWDLLIIWICFLSFVTVAQNFSSFQSDNLLLEASFLGIIIAPFGLRPGLAEMQPPSFMMVLIMWWLCFRIMFQSGIGKLISKDSSWRDLSALHHYHENCPFPTWISWYLHRFPPVFHQLAAFMTLCIEIICPLFMLMGPLYRVITFFIWRAFQGLILSTSNYSVLNYTSIAVSVFLLHDQFLHHAWEWSQAFWAPIVTLPAILQVPTPITPVIQSWTQWIWPIASSLVITLLFYNSFLLFLKSIRLPIDRLPKIVLLPLRAFRVFRSSNKYGLFAQIPKRRLHLIFEASYDNGDTWHPYYCRWQCQKLTDKPQFMAPHFPRLDWNLWFASEGVFTQYPFIEKIAQKLRDQSKDVMALFQQCPFPDQKPDQVRVKQVQYWFSDKHSKKEHQQWWRAEDRGLYYSDQ